MHRLGVDGAQKRTRRSSISASATRRANSRTSALASGPAISRASASISSGKNGIRKKPARSTRGEAHSAPCGRGPGAVFGPVLACALARFALILRGLDTPGRSLLIYLNALRPPASNLWAFAPSVLNSRRASPGFVHPQARLKYLEFAFLHFVHVPPQRFAEHRPTPFDSRRLMLRRVSAILIKRLIRSI